MEIPNELITDTGWPSDEVLKSCGAKIFVRGPACVVEIGSRRFSEGLTESTIRALNDDKSEALNKDQTKKTYKPIVH